MVVMWRPFCDPLYRYHIDVNMNGTPGAATHVVLGLGLIGFLARQNRVRFFAGKSASYSGHS
jgi:hypothetical protein